MHIAPATVDAYLASLPEAQRRGLESVRQRIRAAVPDAEERISYGIPTYRFRKKMLVAFGAGKAHLALYALSGTTLAVLGDAVGGRLRGKGTLHFAPDDPLPEDLLRRILAARLAEIDGAARNMG